MRKTIGKFTIYVLMVTLLSPGIIFGDQTENYRKYNPDGEKYEFAKNYISSLGYLKFETSRLNLTSANSWIQLEESEKGRRLIDEIKKENINWRVARNFLKKYDDSQNGLILKTVAIFGALCDQQILYNKREETLLREFYEAQANDQMEEFDREAFEVKYMQLSDLRKESLKDLLEASMLVSKILVSDKVDQEGNFTHLGITLKQKEKLILRLDEFYGDQYKGEVRQGQTFLQASISAIRSVLQDARFETLE